MHFSVVSVTSTQFIPSWCERGTITVTRTRSSGPAGDRDRDDQRQGDDRNIYDSFFGRSESDDDGPTVREGQPGERIRTRLGLSHREWTWLVSILMFLPYPIFVYVGFVYDVSDILFMLGTLVFSLLLIAVSFYL